MARVSLIFLLLISVSAAEVCPADTGQEVSGKLELVGGTTPHLRMEGLTSPLLIDFATEDAMSDVSTLRDGDELQGEGIVNLSEKTLELFNVTAVGVQRLMGTWRSKEDGTEFNFWDFDTLYIKTLEESNSRRWVYQLNPEASNKWSIQMESEDLLEFGTIEIIEGVVNVQLIFCLLDPETGATKSKHTLIRFHSKGPAQNNADAKINLGSL